MVFTNASSFFRLRTTCHRCIHINYYYYEALGLGSRIPVMIVISLLQYDLFQCACTNGPVHTFTSYAWRARPPTSWLDWASRTSLSGSSSVRPTDAPSLASRRTGRFPSSCSPSRRPPRCRDDSASPRRTPTGGCPSTLANGNDARVVAKYVCRPLSVVARRATMADKDHSCARIKYYAKFGCEERS